MPKGVLFLVVGASEPAKQVVIDGARRALADDSRFFFPRRIITAAHGVGNEVHVAVTHAQFDDLRRQGDFFLCWGAGGLNYALPGSVEDELESGRSVVANVSRAIIGQARRKAERVVVVAIATPVDEATERRRGQPAGIAGGEAAGTLVRPAAVPAVTIIGGALDDMVSRFVAILRDGHIEARVARRATPETRPLV